MLYTQNYNISGTRIHLRPTFLIITIIYGPVSQQSHSRRLFKTFVTINNYMKECVFFSKKHIAIFFQIPSIARIANDTSIYRKPLASTRNFLHHIEQGVFF